MSPGPASSLWKHSGGFKFSTGDRYSTEDQVQFHNEGFAEYFVDMTMTVEQFESILGTQFSHVPHLSLYMHTEKDEFVGSALAGKNKLSS
jgi:hypothetical protein